MSEELALFPLPVVVFPGCRMPLQVFEPRYLDLVKSSLAGNRPFGIATLRGDPGEQVLSKSQGDASPAVPDILSTGTLVSIVDFNHQPNGLLGITVEGLQRFEITGTRYASDYLIMADVDSWQEDVDAAIVPVPQEHELLVDVLLSLLAHPYVAKLGYDENETAERWMADAASTGYHLSYLLPLPLDERYKLLLERDNLARLAKIQTILDRINGEA